MKRLCFCFLLLMAGNARAQPRGVRLSYTSSLEVHSHITVAWNTDGNCGTEVRYGTDPDHLDRQATGQASSQPVPEVGVQHEVTLSSLQPQTLYYFQAGDDGCGFSEVFSFRTGPDDPCTPFTFVAGGDMRSNDGVTGPSEFWGPILGEFMLQDPLFVLVNGDLVEEGAEATQWRNWVDSIHGLTAAVMPSIGNHDDDHVEGDDALYNRVFALPRNDDPGSGTEDFYYFVCGDVIFVTLSTQTFHAGEDFSMQAQWLDRVLTDVDRTWKIVQFHHPVYATDIGISHPPDEQWQNDDLVPVLDAHHVDVVLTSHNHVYERFRPMAGNPGNWAEGTEVQSYEDGSLYIISGGMGAVPIFVFDAAPRPAVGSEVRTGDHHYIVFRVGADRLEMNVVTTYAGYELAVNRPGEIVDRVVIVKPENQLLGAAACEPAGTFDGDEDGFFSDTDCDDTDPSIRPNAVEICDGKDNDCDGQTDEDLLDCTPPGQDGGCGCRQVDAVAGGSGDTPSGLPVVLILVLLMFGIAAGRRGSCNRDLPETCPNSSGWR